MKQSENLKKTVDDIENGSLDVDNKRLQDVAQWYKSGNVGHRINEYESYDGEKAFKRFYKTVSHKDSSKWIYISSAVAAVLIIGLFLYPVFISKTPTHRVPHFYGDQAPVLNLADGRTIVLSDTCSLIVETNEIDVSSVAVAESEVNKVNELVIPRGGEFRMILDDGTRVWVNSESKLSYSTDFLNNRRVEVSGQAFFDVVKNGTPFIVKCSAGEINVLGTSFDVIDYPNDNTQITLVSGCINFSGKESQTLSPGEQLSIDSLGNVSISKVDTDMYMGWIEGLTFFKGESLGKIMKQIERVYDVNIYFENERLSNICFSGECCRDLPLDKFLKLLSTTNEFHYEMDGRKVFIKE